MKKLDSFFFFFFSFCLVSFYIFKEMTSCRTNVRERKESLPVNVAVILEYLVIPRKLATRRHSFDEFHFFLS